MRITKPQEGVDRMVNATKRGDYFVLRVDDRFFSMRFGVRVARFRRAAVSNVLGDGAAVIVIVVAALSSNSEPAPTRFVK